MLDSLDSGPLIPGFGADGVLPELVVLDEPGGNPYWYSQHGSGGATFASVCSLESQPRTPIHTPAMPPGRKLKSRRGMGGGGGAWCVVSSLEALSGEGWCFGGV